MGNNKIKKLILDLTPNSLIEVYQKTLTSDRKIEEEGYGKFSFSQEGEDLFLIRIFENIKNGFYIDVGAHHPIRFSNTYLLYKKGWNGINIDATPGSMKLFNKLRPRDTNLELGISNSKEKLKYYLFNESALNTFSKPDAERSKLNSDYRILDEVHIITNTLEEVLDKHINEGKKINYLNIDVEGLDLQVLKSNNWNKFSPEIISIELLSINSIIDVQKSETYKFLLDRDYVFFAKTWNTCFFKKRDS